MYLKKSVAVVVPAFNEEKLIGRVIETMPNFVDFIVVVDDGSVDKTADAVQNHAAKNKRKVLLISHESNEGVGAARATGYKWARDHDIDVTACMDGDGQMDATSLQSIVEPVAKGWTDFAKGNRLFTGEAWKVIPRKRYMGNAILSFLTKIASGYWHVADSQSGYTAFNMKVLNTIDWDSMYKRYGQPNDLLVHLNVYNFRVIDIPIKPIYNIGETSNMKIASVVFSLSYLLFRKFLWRLKEKYVIRDFHPLVFFYVLGFVLLLLAFPLGIRLAYFSLFLDQTRGMNALAFLFTSVTGLQSLFFAMWFDMYYNRHLKGKNGN